MIYLPEYLLKEAITTPLAIVGTGGFARDTLCTLIDVLRWAGKTMADMDVVFTEPDIELKRRQLMGLQVVAQSEIDLGHRRILVAINNPQVRQKVVGQLGPKAQYATLVHPNVVFSEFSSVGTGSIICPGTVITAHVCLGAHTQLNHITTIGHDSAAEDYLSTAPGANISGNCALGQRVYIGSNAVVRQGLRITHDVLIGMAAVVTKDLNLHGVYIGNPARWVREV